jgi:hypothetical protein
MVKKVAASIFLFIISFGIFSYYSNLKVDNAMVEESTSDVPTTSNSDFFDPMTLYRDWKRPEGPARVGIQIGHWKAQDAPDELETLRTHTGSSGGGKTELQVNTQIAQLVADQLRKNGAEVELLPTTIEPKYWADVFIAIHADGSTDKTVSGYKFAGPWRDFTGKSDELVSILETEYANQTKLIQDPNITRNMRGYYAFSWWRYEHSIHPMTTAVIAETGFLTNKSDQKLLIKHPEIPAKAIADGILEYLKKEELLQ